jgi:hypothetical protein
MACSEVTYSLDGNFLALFSARRTSGGKER